MCHGKQVYVRNVHDRTPNPRRKYRQKAKILAEVSIACSLTSVDDTKAEGACWSKKGRWSVQRNYSCAACKNLRLLHKRALCPSKPHRRSFFFLCLAKLYAMPSHSDPYRRSRPGLRTIKSLFGRLGAQKSETGIYPANLVFCISDLLQEITTAPT